MPHKSICPICGKLAFLHAKTVGEDTTLYWMCSDCDRPFEVIILPFTKEEAKCSQD